MRRISNVRFLPEAAISILLTVAVLVVYSQARGFDFVHFDDFAYVSNNYFVKKGISPENIRWAFQSIVVGNWHPLTMISHMADVELSGMNAGAHHMTNVLLHLLNSLLLFWALRSMTGSVWRSGLAAALFAVHPLHVESVAWISERKDVLSTFFMMLTLWSYAHYVRGLKNFWYTASFLFFALGLMAKPMLVTLPFVLLLLDFWPFKRLIFSEEGNSGRTGFNARALWEKIPFLILTFVFSAVSFAVQKKTGSVESLAVYPLVDRIAHAIVSYVLYLGKAVCPIHLSAFYPRPAAWAWWQASGSLLLLGLFSWGSIRSARKYPWAFVGWFWFIGTLVPVIGIVQVGLQGMADRYAYIPLIGIYIAFSWSVFEVFNRYRFGRIGLAAFAAVLLANLMIGGFLQTRHWRNTRTLFENAVSVDSGNWLAHTMLGGDLIRGGEIQKGLSHIQTALQLKPDYAGAHHEMAMFFMNAGEKDKAALHFSKSLQFNPYDARSHNNFGVLLSLQGNTAEALTHFQRAIEIQPDMIDAYKNLGTFWAIQGQHDNAMDYFKKVLEMDPADQKAAKSMAAVVNDKQKSLKYSKKDEVFIEQAVGDP